MKYKNDGFSELMKSFSGASAVRIIDESCNENIQSLLEIFQKKFIRHKVPYSILFSHYQGTKYIKFIQCGPENQNVLSSVINDIYNSEFPRLFSRDKDNFLIIRLMTTDDYLSDYGNEIL